MDKIKKIVKSIDFIYVLLAVLIFIGVHFKNSVYLSTDPLFQLSEIITPQVGNIIIVSSIIGIIIEFIISKHWKNVIVISEKVYLYLKNLRSEEEYLPLVAFIGLVFWMLTNISNGFISNILIFTSILLGIIYCLCHFKDKKYILLIVITVVIFIEQSFLFYDFEVIDKIVNQTIVISITLLMLVIIYFWAAMIYNIIRNNFKIMELIFNIHVIIVVLLLSLYSSKIFRRGSMGITGVMKEDGYGIVSFIVILTYVLVMFGIKQYYEKVMIKEKEAVT